MSRTGFAVYLLLMGLFLSSSAVSAQQYKLEGWDAKPTVPRPKMIDPDRLQMLYDVSGVWANDWCQVYVIKQSGTDISWVSGSIGQGKVDGTKLAVRLHKEDLVGKSIVGTVDIYGDITKLSGRKATEIYWSKDKITFKPCAYPCGGCSPP